MRRRIRLRAVVPSLYEPEHGAVGLAWVVRPWTRGRLEAVGTPMKTIKPTQAVATILSRYQRRRNCLVPVTATDAYADTLARACGDDVDLDPVERGLIHLKRQKVISCRRLVTLLARHQREIRPERRLPRASQGAGLKARYQYTKRHHSWERMVCFEGP